MDDQYPPYQFNVGSIACTIFNEGTRLAGLEKLPQAFPNANLDDLMKAIEETGGEPIYNSMNILMMEAGDELVLVDVGFGRVDYEGIGLTFDYMETLGISPADITLVILSHFHGDHINGLVNTDGNLNFPNARYVCARDEYNGWLSEEAMAKFPEDRLKSIKEHILPIKDKLTLVDYGEEIIPGITAISSKGHSPGHMSLQINSDGERMMHLVDTLHRALQMRNPAWSINFDADPILSAETRRDLLEQVSEENTLTMFYHLPFPGLGYVEADGEAFQWCPVDEVIEEEEEEA